ncbi:MAG TPA: MASE3 domain-containing protein [Pseudobacteroides sp.]|uniref:MASE3 domain-containing protein n=1 Tax=Pseudobacteroides sp. TaxID=1968840 RepID=UPI002F93C579
MCHTILEVTCVFIALSSFLIIWLSHDVRKYSLTTLGFGFLSVAVFDIFHVIYYPELKLFPIGYDDLSTRFWVVGRISEAAILTLSTYKAGIFSKNKYMLLTISLFYSFGVSMALINFPSIMPTLFIPSIGVTNVKIVLEYAIIALFIFGIYRISKMKRKSKMISYRHIYLSILLLISAEFCFTKYVSYSSFSTTMGHVLKVASYFYVYYGIYVNNIKYPYEKMKIAKSNLKETKKELYAILNGLPLALATYDNSLHVAFINDKALELLECNRKDVLGLTADEMAKKFMCTDFIQKKNLIAHSITSNKNIPPALSHYTTQKGNQLDLSISTFKYNRGLMVSFSDAKKDQELADLEIQTLTILNSLSNLVLLTDSNARIILANKALLEFIDMDFKNIEGMHIRDFNTLLSFSIDGIPYSSIKGKIKMSKPTEASLKTLDGNTKHVLFHSSPIKNTKGQTIGHIGVSSDITQYKKEQEKILQQEKLAIMGQMGAGIVHETKNHLASIKGYCQLLSISSNEKSKKYIERIECISGDLNRVIIDFLTIAKPSPPIMDIVSLNEIIESMRYMLESPSFIKGVKIDIDLAEFDGDIIADESGIKQIILNMTKNAIEAMSGVSDARLCIQTSLSRTGDDALLIISDNGHGLSPEQIKTLGTPFYTTKSAGTGLGLSVCYRIIKEHNGRVEVESTKGKGTKFTISFPLYTDNSTYQLSNTSMLLPAAYLRAEAVERFGTYK